MKTRTMSEGIDRATKRAKRLARRKGKPITWQEARECAKAWARGMAGHEMWPK